MNEIQQSVAGISRVVMRATVERALNEDLGRGDVTTDACVPMHLQGRATLVARQALTFCGGPVVQAVFAEVDPELKVRLKVSDGTALKAGQSALELEGRANSILKGERVALNFLQRLCGIATKTADFRHALGEAQRTRITDTRKTTPGLRAFERYAVRCGGGHNHRDDLSSAVLIKDNHIAATGSVTKAIESARAHAPHTSKIECEVDTMEQLQEALDAKADIVLLDNFDDDDLERAVHLVAGRAFVEVSGGVTLERIGKIGSRGVDAISVGALTHSALSADLALDWLS